MISNPALLLLTALLLLPLAVGAANPDDSLAGKPPVEPAARGETRVSVGVFYLTNRRRQEGKPAGDAYGGERGEPRFGRCEVEFTPIPIINSIAPKVPFYLPGETSRVRSAEQADARVFWNQLTGALEQTSSGSVVVFVHGFNYGFERTCRMAAEMQRGLRGKAAVLMFSWPSNGLPTDYVQDQADLEWSVPLLASFLGELGNRVGQETCRFWPTAWDRAASFSRSSGWGLTWIHVR